MRFAYEGVHNLTGEERRGAVEADTRDEAFSKLVRDGVILTDDLRPVGGVAWSMNGVRVIWEQVVQRNRLEYARLNFWRTALAFQHQARSMRDVLASVAEDCESRYFSEIMLTISSSMYSGRGLTLADALAEHAEFPAWEVDMVRVAAESNIALTQVIPQIIGVIEAKRKWRAKQSADSVDTWVSYPLLIITIFYMARYFTPAMYRASAALGSKSPPWYIGAFGAVAQFLTSPITIASVLAALVFVALLAPGLLREPSLLSFIERVRWTMPMSKTRDLTVDRSIAVKLLAAFTHAGASETRRLEWTARSMRSPRFRAAILRQMAAVESKRVSFRESFLAERLWGSEIRSLIRTLGAADLKSAFDTLARDYEATADTAWASVNQVKQTVQNLVIGAVILVISIVVTIGPIAVMSNAF